MITIKKILEVEQVPNATYHPPDEQSTNNQRTINEQSTNNQQRQWPKVNKNEQINKNQQKSTKIT